MTSRFKQYNRHQAGFEEVAGLSGAAGAGYSHFAQRVSPTGETTVVFRGSAFAGDVGKTNLTVILEEYGIGKHNIRSLLLWTSS